jgi:prefoldin subunit 5
MALEVKMNEALQIVDKNIQFLAGQLDKSNKRIAELENQVVILTDRVDYLYEDPLP